VYLIYVEILRKAEHIQRMIFIRFTGSQCGPVHLR